MIAFDIETRPLPLERLKEVVKPFDPDSVPRPPDVFDVNSVKTGHLKDPAKIREKISKARKDHEDALKNHDELVANKEAAYWSDVLDKAALRAETGSVCAIGMANDAGKFGAYLDCDMTEREMLVRFWRKYEECAAKMPQAIMVGFYCKKFDIPFLVRRSWYLRVNVPRGVFNIGGYISHPIVDLVESWQCGNRQDNVSLDTIAKSLGIAGKHEGCTGAEFHRYLDDPALKEDAILYLEQDVFIPLEIAKVMGL